jgi:hypothetical protein
MDSGRFVSPRPPARDLLDLKCAGSC